MNASEIARNRWFSLLPRLGIETKFLNGRQTPCPICGGKDRFRFDNKEGRGTFFCNQCGSGDGYRLLELKHGWSFAEAAARVRELVPNSTTSKPPVQLDDDRRRKILTDMWQNAAPVTSSNMAGAYLASRGIIGPYPSCLRFMESCRVKADGVEALPAMIARVFDPKGKPVTLHRTYLQNGSKAQIESPRRLMPGHTPPGSYIPLAPAGEVLGIAEGIETALSAMQQFGVPVWAVVNAQSLMAFEFPAGVKHLRIFGDNDRSFTGQSAAYALANRLAKKSKSSTVNVEIPSTVGFDWNDVICSVKHAA